MKLPVEKISEVCYNAIREAKNGYGGRCWDELSAEERSTLDKQITCLINHEPLAAHGPNDIIANVSEERLIQVIVEGLR